MVKLYELEKLAGMTQQSFISEYSGIKTTYFALVSEKLYENRIVSNKIHLYQTASIAILVLIPTVVFPVLLMGQKKGLFNCCMLAYPIWGQGKHHICIA